MHSRPSGHGQSDTAAYALCGQHTHYRVMGGYGRKGLKLIRYGNSKHNVGAIVNYNL